MLNLQVFCGTHKAYIKKINWGIWIALRLNFGPLHLIVWVFFFYFLFTINCLEHVCICIQGGDTVSPQEAQLPYSDRWCDTIKSWTAKHKVKGHWHQTAETGVQLRSCKKFFSRLPHTEPSHCEGTQLQGWVVDIHVSHGFKGTTCLYSMWCPQLPLVGAAVIHVREHSCEMM